MQSKIVVAVAGMLIASALVPVEDAAARRAKHMLEVMKDCSPDNGVAGSYCLITSSNLDIISVGTKIYYDSALNIPQGLLDSDVVLDAGDGNRGLGHCNLDLSSGSGICIFSDGTGNFAGFEARVNVSTTDGVHYLWQGTYSFDPTTVSE
jgi:hypothetical protein